MSHNKLKLRNHLKIVRFHFNRNKLRYIFILSVILNIVLIDSYAKKDRELKQNIINDKLKEKVKYVNDFGCIIDLEGKKQVKIKKIEKIIDIYNSELKNKRDISSKIHEMSWKYKDNLNSDLICATITQESYWNIIALSEKGAISLMQIMPNTGIWLAYLNNYNNYNDSILYNPIVNIDLGCFYLNKLMQRYNNIDQAWAFYNGGGFMAKHAKLNKDLLCNETRDYLIRVMKFYNKFKNIT